PAGPPAGGLGRVLLALCAASARSGRCFVRRGFYRRADRHHDNSLRRPGYYPRLQPRARLAVARFVAAALWHGARRAGRAALGDAAAEHDHQPGDHPRALQPDPLAEPLACGAAELELLSERFRRPYRTTRHAD